MKNIVFILVFLIVGFFIGCEHDAELASGLPLSVFSDDFYSEFSSGYTISEANYIVYTTDVIYYHEFFAKTGTGEVKAKTIVYNPDGFDTDNWNILISYYNPDL